MTKSTKSMMIIASAMVAALVPGAVSAQEKTIRIATEGAYRPHNFFDAQGNLAGYEIDLGNDLCKRMQVKCEWIHQAWDGAIPGLNAGRFDAIMTAIIITERRKQSVDFAGPYVESAFTFYALKGTPAASIPKGPKISLEGNQADFDKAIEELKVSLKGKKIGVGIASTSLAFTERYLKDAVTIQQYRTFEQQDLDVQAGRTDVAMTQFGYLSSLITRPEGKDFVLVGPTFVKGIFGDGAGVAVRKGDDATRKMFQAAIDAAKADGTIKRLTEKWFNADLTPQ